MSIYNCAPTLKEAVNSIQNQTYQDWELILCDDGSTDNTFQLAQQIMGNDSRIRLLQNETNLGLNKSLNKCLAHANGNYIARMDGDDICAPDRFEKELAILETEPDIAIVSTAMNYFDENGIWGQSKPKEYPDKMDFVNGPPIAHAPCLVRKEAYLAVKGYSERKIHRRGQDYYLWASMYSKGYRAKNILEPLYSMRDDQNALNRRTAKSYLYATYTRYMVYKMLGIHLRYYVYILVSFIKIFIPKFLMKMLHNAKSK